MQIQSDPILQLQQQEDVLDAMMSVGLTVMLTENTRYSVVKALTLFYSCFNSKQAMLEQFWQGAEDLGLKSLLVKYQGMSFTNHL